MEEKIVIKISDIVNKLNNVELKALCDEYEINTASFSNNTKGIYKNNLKKKIIKAVGGKEAINRHTFSKYDEYINVTPCPSVSGQGVTLILALFITLTSAIFTISFLRCLSPST